MSGGIICCIGQLIHDFAKLTLNYSESNVAAFTAIVLVFMGATLTGVGIYDKIGAWAGAGSVVPRDIPANTFAAGAPARGFRPITEQDDIAKLFPELRQGRFSANIARSICSKSLVWGYSAMSG